MQILLTGATGFIGQNLAQFLMNKGCKVQSLARKPCPVKGVEHIQLTSLTEADLSQSLAGYHFDVVVHLAAAGVHPSDRDMNTLIEVNTNFPARMVSVAKQKGVQAVVVMGSSAEYKGAIEEKPLKENAPLEIGKLYGATKASGSLLALAVGKEKNLPVGVVRLFNVFGLGEADHRLLPSLRKQLSLGKPVKLSLGTQVRDFIYIEDVCAGLFMIVNDLLEKKLKSDVYNLGTGIGHSVADFAHHVATTLGADESLLKFGALPYRADDLPFVVADVSLLKTYGWKPKFSMQAGIAHALSKPLSSSYVFQELA